MNSLYTGSYWLATGIPLVTGSSDIQLVASHREFVLGRKGSLYLVPSFVIIDIP